MAHTHTFAGWVGIFYGTSEGKGIPGRGTAQSRSKSSKELSRAQNIVQMQREEMSQTGRERPDPR